MSRYTLLKLRGRIIEEYGTYADFAKKLDVSPAIVTSRLTGKTGFSLEEIENWSRILDIPMKEAENYFFA